MKFLLLACCEQLSACEGVYSDEIVCPPAVAVKSWGESCNMQSRKQTHQKFVFHFCERLLRSI